MEYKGSIPMQESIKIGDSEYRIRLLPGRLYLDGVEKSAIVDHEERSIDISLDLGPYGIALAAAHAVSGSWAQFLAEKQGEGEGS